MREEKARLAMRSRWCSCLAGWGEEEEGEGGREREGDERGRAEATVRYESEPRWVLVSAVVRLLRLAGGHADKVSPLFPFFLIHL
jgi:hypothetical protein